MKTLQTSEYHLVTAHGRTAMIVNERERAIIRWREVGSPPDWKIQQVVTERYDVTPACMDPKRAPKSAAILKIARDNNLPVIDVKISA